MITFSVYGEPVPKGSKRPFMPGWKPGQVDRPKVALVEMGVGLKPWMEKIKLAALAARGPNWTLLDGPLWLDAEFYFPRPKSHFDSKGALKAGAPRHHSIRPDRDKVLRGLCDALTGIIWTDDSRVADSRVLKFYMNPTQMPGVDVQVRLLGER